ncbi:Gfo/Idh/MocA family oxidoreductase [Bdellovibrio sp. 22V]|uniref:Gfo/Idh/MocA family protein n=1 Tax=Bdellovibrio TaxID=958 RepID=UPI002543EAC8|nr:Gfo/Idh/MocA family oxidoreductase [Bdellovibrio sp. 22V]WII72579.1 Gfo/Idh/MocA family oxidoreductase [Bdellovibrio sp. 22V]
MATRFRNRSTKIRYAVVGLGHIAQNAVLPAFEHAKNNSELTALVSGDEEKLSRLSRAYGVEDIFTYDEYLELLQSDLIDAVYIALPNHLHYKYVVAALECGIHVLCEKPLALNVDEARRMIKSAENNDCKLMTAYRLHFQEANLKAMNIARSGQLGDIRFFNSIFTMRVKNRNIRLERAKGGGPLYDIGIYCINAARSFFGELPEQVFAFNNRGYDQRFKEVDEMVSVNMKFSDGRMGNFVVSFSASPLAVYDVVGTQGSLRLESAYEYYEDMEMTITKPPGIKETRTFKKSDQFAPELLYFSDCVLNDRNPEPNASEGLLDLMVIEALQHSLREGRPIRIPAFSKEGRPTLSQMIRRPPVKKPMMVHVSGPSRD